MAFGKFGKYYPGGAEILPQDFELISALREDFEAVKANEGAGHDMQFRCEVQQQRVRTDRMHVHYILMNLLLNAVKYSPAGSRVELHVRREGGRIVFSVADQGIGVPQDELAELFSPFYRASNVGTRPGTGMGLAIVKKSAQLIGADIKVDTPEQGGGARFTVALEAGPDPTQQGAPAMVASV